MKLRNNQRKFARSSRRTRQGFTLLELLLVMAILVVLAGLAGFAVLGMQDNAYANSAKLEIRTLASSCKAYKLNVGSFPVKLEDLYNRPSGIDQATWGGPYLDTLVVNDPWNRQYKYAPDDGARTVSIRSAGPDGQWDNEDDVSNSN